MTSAARKITAEEAEGLLCDGDLVIHNMSFGGFMIGADWDREDAVQAFRDADAIYLSDGLAAGMGHPIVVRQKNGRLSGFQADADKVRAFEAVRFGVGRAA